MSAGGMQWFVSLVDAVNEKVPVLGGNAVATRMFWYAVYAFIAHALIRDSTTCLRRARDPEYETDEGSACGSCTSMSATRLETLTAVVGTDLGIGLVSLVTGLIAFRVYNGPADASSVMEWVGTLVSPVFFPLVGFHLAGAAVRFVAESFKILADTDIDRARNIRSLSLRTRMIRCLYGLPDGDPLGAVAGSECQVGDDDPLGPPLPAGSIPLTIFSLSVRDAVMEGAIGTSAALLLWGAYVLVVRVMGPQIRETIRQMGGESTENGDNPVDLSDIKNSDTSERPGSSEGVDGLRSGSGEKKRGCSNTYNVVFGDGASMGAPGTSPSDTSSVPTTGSATPDGNMTQNADPNTGYMDTGIEGMGAPMTQNIMDSMAQGVGAPMAQGMGAPTVDSVAPGIMGGPIAQGVAASGVSEGRTQGVNADMALDPKDPNKADDTQIDSNHKSVDADSDQEGNNDPKKETTKKKPGIFGRMFGPTQQVDKDVVNARKEFRKQLNEFGFKQSDLIGDDGFVDEKKVSTALENAKIKELAKAEQLRKKYAAELGDKNDKYNELVNKLGLNVEDIENKYKDKQITISESANNLRGKIEERYSNREIRKSKQKGIAKAWTRIGNMTRKLNRRGKYGGDGVEEEGGYWTD